MQLTIEQALAGKSTCIKGKEYLSTEAYITPFLDKMSKYTDNFIINGIQPGQMTLTKEGDVNLEDSTFNRMWIQAVMPDDAYFDNHSRCVGMIYGLDVREPIVKFYSGGLNMACCNLCVFSPSFLAISNLEPETAIDFSPIDRLMSQTDNVKNILERLSNTEVEYNEKAINECLGNWVRKSIHSSFISPTGKVKMATSAAIDTYKLLYEKEDSPYYVPKDTVTDMFNIYNAWTQTITSDKKDIMNKVEKTLLVSKILNI